MNQSWSPEANAAPAANSRTNSDAAGTEATDSAALDRAIFEFHGASDRGERPRPEDWIARHPRIADGLKAYFDDLAAVSLVPFSANVGDGLHPGAVLGDYELLERLGQGAQGSVWKARLRTAREIEAAIKTMHGPAGHDAVAIERFRNDARSLARMTHPNIVRTSYVGEVAGRWFIVMELVEGGSLADHLPVIGDDLRRAVAVVEKVARAIHHAHTRADGVIHLDLKPGNILLTADGEPKVTDFGLAIRGAHSGRFEPSRDSGGFVPETAEERSATLARAGIVGTLPYMSPEMAAGRWQDVSTLSDVYGLGAVLYALLTGGPPIAGGAPVETLERVVAGAITPPRERNRRVDRELNAVCLKCLARDPAGRYGSADALANDLRRWQERRATLAGGRPSPLREARFWARRHPGILAAAALMLLSFVVLGIHAKLDSDQRQLETARRANSARAAQLARQLDRELHMIRAFTGRLAESDALRNAMRPASGEVSARDRRRAVQAVIDNVDQRQLFDLAGGNPLVNVLVLDPQGRELADTAAKGGELLPHTFAVRDYVRAFHDRDLPRSHVHVARAFHSIKDGSHKIAVSTRVWDAGGEQLGFVVANFPIGHQLLGFNLLKEPGDALVLCPLDMSAPELDRAEPANAPWVCAVVLARDYHAAHRQRPKQDNSPEIGRFQRDRRLIQWPADPRNGKLIDFHRVGETDLLIVSYRAWP
jgi:serine/threonine-protein kinase